MIRMRMALRTVHTAAATPRLTRFSLNAPKFGGCCYSYLNNYPLGGPFIFLLVEVEFADGSVFGLSAEYLRIYSPAADGKMRSIGGEKVIFGRRHVGIMSAEPVGNYGVRIIFDDLHKTGIYTWEYLYNLGSNRFTLMRNYINTLKKHGVSRDPGKRK